MPNNMAAYLSSGIMMAIFKSPGSITPATLAFALTSTPPTVNSYTEITNANAYARQSLPSGSTGQNWSFAYPNSGMVFNNPVVTFPVCTTADWGWVSGCVLMDSASYGAGNMLFYTTLTTPKYIGVNDQFYIPASGSSSRVS